MRSWIVAMLVLLPAMSVLLDACGDSGTDASVAADSGTRDQQSNIEGGTVPSDGGPNAVTCAEPPCVVSIAASSTHTCAVLADGRTLCWGANKSGGLGVVDGDASVDAAVVLRPLPVGWLGAAQVVSAADNNNADPYTCATKLDAGVACWGSNASGNLAKTIAGVYGSPVDVAGLTNGGHLGTSGTHVCTLVPGSRGSIYCWGGNANGQLGRGSASASPETVPMPVALPAQPITVGVGDGFTCALVEGNKVLCWGEPPFKTGGDDWLLPTEVPTMSGIEELSVRAKRVCGRTTDGRVLCAGRVGDTFRNEPSVVALPRPALKIGGGSAHVCAALDDESLWCWGRSIDGQSGLLPDGGVGEGTVALEPRPVSGIDGKVVEIVGGYYHTCVRLAAGGMRCFGAGTSGQLGHGMKGSSFTPVRPSL